MALCVCVRALFSFLFIKFKMERMLSMEIDAYKYHKMNGIMQSE